MSIELITNNLKLPNGVILKNRIGLSPMETMTGIEGGKFSESEMNYYHTRNDIGQLLITGAVAVSKSGIFAHSQPQIDTDNNLDNFSKVANLMQEKGNKAVVQLHHAGREATGTVQIYGYSYGPSDGPENKKFPWLDYETHELSNTQIIQIIQDFAEGARRCLKAGFSGVEIHGANHYLIQQFLSSYSNRRTDKWGGNRDKRLNFLLAIIDEIEKVRKEENASDFIIGLKLNAEEVHGNNIGFTIDDVLYWLDILKKTKIDFIEISTNMSDAKAFSQKGNNSKPANQLIQEKLSGIIPHAISGSIFAPDDVTFLLENNFCDIALFGREAVVDPEWLEKVKKNQEDNIIYEIPYTKLHSWNIPEGMLSVFQMPIIPDLPVSGDTTGHWKTRKAVWKR